MNPENEIYDFKLNDQICDLLMQRIKDKLSDPTILDDYYIFDSIFHNVLHSNLRGDTDEGTIPTIMLCNYITGEIKLYALYILISKEEIKSIMELYK